MDLTLLLRTHLVHQACIERGDFASETSSRSTKLIWAGIKYLASAAAALISWNLLTSPIQTVSAFYGEFKMVFQVNQYVACFGPCTACANVLRVT